MGECSTLIRSTSKGFGSDHRLGPAGNLDQLLSPLNGSILQGDALFVRRE